ncbi:sensor histidine kinase [Streptomyces abyssomicinicus]|uniref:sensor histidine kinase n=1 Tax=Streptomyces abyssomicinicus TaxID=574929 RepID=UPI0012507C59|nr:GAF domain-containing protein [Streptomyces abyssomicinicus]
MGRTPVDDADDLAASQVRLPHLRLDDLLGELQGRLQAARGTRDRVHGLLEAVLSVGRDLDLEQVLRGVVEAATVLVDARYGALGVLTPDGQGLSSFYMVGVDEDRIAQISSFPAGHGVLGQLVRHPEPLRLDRLSDHPESFGFPAHHPPMESFLGVPVRVRDKVFGNLYLTEKGNGQGFDEEDVAVLSTLAVAAGVAIENARLYEESLLRQRLLRAGAEITRSLMSGSDRGEALALIAERAHEVTGAQITVVAVPVEDTGSLVLELAIGEDAEEYRGLVPAQDDSLIGRAFATGHPVVVHDVSKDHRALSALPRTAGMGPAVALPIGSGAADVRGVVLLVRETGRTAFTATEIEPLRNFAAQAAVAMELADRRREAEQIAMLQDRDRIARDLHDLAVQRLFATGMTLQSAGRFISHPEAAERVTQAVDDLDETIKIIRSAIFGLRSRDAVSGAGLRSRVVRTVAEAARDLGFTPGVRTEGLIDNDVPAALADQVVAVLSEALTDVARRAGAGRADVVLAAVDGQVVLTVTDDGASPAQASPRDGLDALTARARTLGGALTLERGEGGGTRLEWRVPLRG